MGKVGKWALIGLVVWFLVNNPPVAGRIGQAAGQAVSGAASVTTQFVRGFAPHLGGK